jgi:hypothetical protein
MSSESCPRLTGERAASMSLWEVGMRFGILREEKREEDLPNELQLGNVGKEVLFDSI